MTPYSATRLKAIEAALEHEQRVPQLPWPGVRCLEAAVREAVLEADVRARSVSVSGCGAGVMELPGPAPLVDRLLSLGRFYFFVIMRNILHQSKYATALFWRVSKLSLSNIHARPFGLS